MEFEPAIQIINDLLLRLIYGQHNGHVKMNLFWFRAAAGCLPHSKIYTLNMRLD